MMNQITSRGHHSAVGKAVEAHRQQVEDRQVRKFGKEFAQFQSNQAQANAQYVIPGQVVDANGQVIADASAGAPEEEKKDKYNQPMIEPAASFAKSAAVWSFQNTEPGKPSMNDPIPKGSYLDVAG